jgi:hypothetical protein
VSVWPAHVDAVFARACDERDKLYVFVFEGSASVHR